MQRLADGGWGDKRETGLGAWTDLPKCGRPVGRSQLKKAGEHQGPLLLFPCSSDSGNHMLRCQCPKLWRSHAWS